MEKLIAAILAGLIFSLTLIVSVTVIFGPIFYVLSHYHYPDGFWFLLGWIFFILFSIGAGLFYFDN